MLASAALLGTTAALPGCSTIGFYTQAIGGQWYLISRREDVSEILDSPETTPELREQLETVEQILAFAESALSLPVEDRYRAYVDVERPYLVWSVVAAGEFETQPLSRCYPIVGCASYRGYFKQSNADAEAQRLRDDGFDVHVGGVAAYSTLGWFDDPIVSTFAGWSEARLAELLFHELAHSVVFVAGDTEFNEAFATFVGERGVSLWLANNERDDNAYRDAQRVEKRLFDLLGRWRERLDVIYARDESVESKRQRKQESFKNLAACYASNRGVLGDGRYDGYMSKPFNNARLATISTYHRWVPAFAELFEGAGEDWPLLFEAVSELGKLPADDRKRQLGALRDEQVAHGGDDGDADQVQCESLTDHAVDAEAPG